MVVLYFSCTFVVAVWGGEPCLPTPPSVMCPFERVWLMATLVSKGDEQTYTLGKESYSIIDTLKMHCLLTELGSKLCVPVLERITAMQ